MGLPAPNQDKGGEEAGAAFGQAEVVGLQPVALVDHVALVDWKLLESIPGERGGSIRVSPEELQDILSCVKDGGGGFRTLAGGSVTNCIRGLAGLGVRCSLVGAVGDDVAGEMFCDSMRRYAIQLHHLTASQGPTGQCACLVDATGNRTMRPCLSDAVRMRAEDLRREHLSGVKWLLFNGYGFYGPELVERAATLARELGVKVAMDLASFEVVRAFRPRLLRLLESGLVDLCFANEDEARELMHGQEQHGGDCLGYLSRLCGIAVVMLGARGCEAQRGMEIARVPAVEVTNVVDTTGAGDLFGAGFIYGLIQGLSLEDCCNVGCCTGAAVVRDLGGEVNVESWAWMQQQLNIRVPHSVVHLQRPTCQELASS